MIAADPASGESFATGSAVNVATRLQQAALPGETLLGATTYGLVRDAVAAEAVEPLDLGGALDASPAFRVVELAEEPVGPGLGRAAPLVGREDELARLRAALAGVQSERRSRVLTVLGDAGIGKTRLAAELVSSTEATVLVGRCVPYGEGATYLPLAEVVRQAVPKRVRGERRRAAGRRRARRRSSPSGSPSSPGEAEGAASTGERFWAVRRFLEALAAERPVLLVLEDVHWAEPTLLDLVEYLAAWASEAPVLVLCLARPELLEHAAGLGRGRDPAGAALAGGVRTSSSPSWPTSRDDVRARVVEAAEGNALFVEQLLAYVVEDEGPEPLDALPPSVEALLASRLDRLEPEERALLERAAVVGKDFSRAAVIHLSPPERAGCDRRAPVHAAPEGPDPRPPVAGVRGRPFPLPPRARSRRRLRRGSRRRCAPTCTSAIATWLEQRDGAAEIVGYHLEQAHRFRAELRPSDPSAAAPRAASRRPARRGRDPRLEACGYARRGQPPRRAALLSCPRAAELLCELGLAQRNAGQADAAERTLEQARAVAEADGDEAAELRARIELAHTRLFSDRHVDSSELLELARDGDPAVRGARRRSRARSNVASSRNRPRKLSRIDGGLAGLRRARARALPALGLVDLGMPPRAGRRSVLRADTRRRGGCALRRAARRGDGADRRAHMSSPTWPVSRALARPIRRGRHAPRADANERPSRSSARRIRCANAGGRVLARIEFLAGDYPAAERALRECCDDVRARRRHRGVSRPSPHSSADALYEQDRVAEEADHWARLAEDTRATRRHECSVLVAVAAGRSSGDETARLAAAEALAREALRIAVGDRRPERARHVPRRPRRGASHREIAHPRRGARDRGGAGLFERKGDTASASAAGFLAERDRA